MKKRVAILGAGGFTGLELLKLLGNRKDVEIIAITSNEYSGNMLSKVIPSFQKSPPGELVFLDHPKKPNDIPDCHLVFLATPDAASLYHVPNFLEAGKKVIDLSGAFRLQDTAEFQKFYQIEHTAPNLLPTAVFGLPEYNRAKIKEASLVANPGCYPTAALVPMLGIHSFLNDFEPRVVIDAKSGTSGAGGRKEKDALGFSTVYQNFRSYKTIAHQHLPEIRQVLREISNIPFHVRFTPHLLPLFRGILATIYLTAKKEIDIKKIKDEAHAFAKKEPFVTFFESPDEIEIRNIQNRNQVHFALDYDRESQIVVIQSAIDNILKGAAGTAIQNMNLMLGFSETEGLA